MRRLLTRRLARAEREGGAVVLFVIAFALVLFVGAGLVVDGGLALNARQQAADVAEEAARAGSNAIDLPYLRATGGVRLNTADAQAAAGNYLAVVVAREARDRDRVLGGVPTASAAQVTVTVDARVNTILLQLIGKSTFDIAAQATACPATGIANGAC